MKTNQEMIRKMGVFNVIQRTSDGYFNATHLLRQWNETYSNEQRRLDKFWDSTHLDELMSEIAKNELNFKSPNFGELKNVLSRDGLVTYLRKLYQKKNCPKVFNVA